MRVPFTVAQGAVVRGAAACGLVAALAFLAVVPGRSAAAEPSASAAGGEIAIVTGGGSGAFGTADPAWTFSNPVGSGPALVAYAHPYYAKPFAGSRYVNTSGSASGGDAASNRTTSYTTTFALPDGFVSPALSGTLFADNAATVYLNGVQIGAQPQTSAAENFQVAFGFGSSDAAQFLTGVNVLRVDNLDLGGSNAINVAAVVRYELSPSRFTGLYAPVRMGGATNVVKAGSVVPLKFNLFDGHGNEVVDPAAIGLTVAGSNACSPQASTAGGASAPVVTTAALRYDVADGHFIANWKAPRTPGCVALSAAGNGVAITATFLLR